jgi:hypothetical protein
MGACHVPGSPRDSPLDPSRDLAAASFGVLVPISNPIFIDWESFGGADVIGRYFPYAAFFRERLVDFVLPLDFDVALIFALDPVS